VTDPKVQLVYRRRPREVVFPRSPPTTIVRPTRAQAECRLKFGELARASKHFTIEEVARMVGGEVVEVNGRKAVRLPNGRILQKHQAFVKAMLSGWRSEHSSGVKMPKWLEELSRAYFPAVRVSAVEEVLKQKGLKA